MELESIDIYLRKSQDVAIFTYFLLSVVLLIQRIRIISKHSKRGLAEDDRQRYIMNDFDKARVYLKRYLVTLITTVIVLLLYLTRVYYGLDASVFFPLLFLLFTQNDHKEMDKFKSVIKDISPQ